MAKQVRKLAEVQESAWTQASGTIMIGAVLFVVSVVLLYCAKYMFHGTVLQAVRVGLGIAAFAGVGVIGTAVYNCIEVRNLRGVSYACPYCEQGNRFESTPNESFDCEFCNRTVHFEEGEPVPVRAVSCPFCHSDHRVAVTVQRYVCDKCNRPLELATESRGYPAPTSAAGVGAVGNMFDVLLVSVDRRQENEVALKLQNLMVVNLPEARRLMVSASTTSPLVVSYGLSQRKAESIRRQLQDLGATATIRPTHENVRAVAKPT